ncbi:MULTISPECIES: PKD domain-containing protein [unclassified Saccharicrinis]|uniref:PKD domain-containing protein n=1 Tax=unclassified Saccharicrinis TaxID=2646859 RepID=UPI003D34E9F6
MKKILYFLSLMLIILSVTSCDEEDYKGLDISKDDREVDVKELMGNLSGHIVIKNAQGDDVTDVDMGQTFYLIDNTEGGVDNRTWTITQAGETMSSDEQLFRVNLSKPGEASISLTSTRSSDGEEVTSTVSLPINKIPVSADYIASPVNEAGVVNQFMGYPVVFTTTVEGSPTLFDWQFVGPETLTSDQLNPTMIFTKAGVYDVTLTAGRDDGAEGITEDIVEKVGFIVVEQLNVKPIRAVATDNKIEIQYNHPIAQTLPSEAINEFSLTINTNSGAVLTPELIRLTVTGEKTLEITFADQMYSDDEVLLSFTSAGSLKDATGLVVPLDLANEPCVYGHNLLLNTDMEDQSVWMYNTNNEGTAEFVNESSVANPIKPYQGSWCRAIVKGPGNCSFAVIQGLEVAEGDVIEIAYEAQRAGNIGGALERRVSTWLGGGSNDAGGNWSSANQGGVGSWETVRKTINVSADTKGKTGVLYFNFLRYNGGETQALWIDNYRVYVPNPRP